MADIFSTDALMGVLEDMTVPKSALLDRYFGTIQTEASEEIHFDRLAGARKLAPFVSPVVAGRIMAERGFKTSTFKPAYVKPKTPLDLNRPLRRAAGETIGGGSLTPAQREALCVAMELEGHVQMIRNRLEWMAASALLTGTVSITGENYPTVSLDFGRDAAHSITLTGNDLWSATHADSKPLEDLQTAATLIAKNGGGRATDVVMEPDAWNAFRNHSTVAGKLDYRNITDTSIAAGAALGRGLVYRGTIDGFNIYVYQDWYEDDAGTITPFFATGKVAVIAPAAVEGVQAFGAIKDAASNYIAVPYFPKTWIENDPGQRMMMTQSAPLVVPTRPDATVTFTVL